MILLIADDLTGACDAAAPFAVRGHATVVSLEGRLEGGEAGALAISTESRDLAPGELGAVYAGLGAADFLGSGLIFKKIDSTLRGNAGAEIALAAEAFGCESAIATPAFPAMGRMVEAGVLRVAGAAFEPVELAAYWRAQGLCGCAQVSPGGVAAELAAGTRFISVDAASDADLDAIAVAGLASTRRVLWAGSAGLAWALARGWAPRGVSLRPCVPPKFMKTEKKADGPANAAGTPARPTSAVLFCIGSDHAVTVEQQREMAAGRRVLAVDAETVQPECVARTLEGGTHVALRVAYGRIGAERIRRLIGDWRGPLVLSGGATAWLVCRALGVREIRIEREIAAGIPRGFISGGLFDGLPIVTKSGGFGKPSALIEILDDLTCPQ